MSGHGAYVVAGWIVGLGLAATPEAWLSVSCNELDASTLRELVQLEVREPPPGTHATIGCDQAAFRIGLEFRDGGRAGREIERTVAVGEVPERYLALELAELLVGAQSPAPEAKPQPPYAQDRAPGPPPRRRGYLLAGARAEGGGSPLLMAGGAQASLGGRLLPALSLRADVTGTGGGRRIGDDVVQTGAVWVGAVLLATADLGPVLLQAGGGARAGGLWLRGLPGEAAVRGRTHAGFSWSPQVSLALLGAVGRRALVHVGIDAGWTLRPVRGLDGADVVVSWSGPWAGLSFGGGWRFGE